MGKRYYERSGESWSRFDSGYLCEALGWWGKNSWVLIDKAPNISKGFTLQNLPPRLQDFINSTDHHFHAFLVLYVRMVDIPINHGDLIMTALPFSSRLWCSWMSALLDQMIAIIQMGYIQLFKKNSVLCLCMQWWDGVDTFGYPRLSCQIDSYIWLGAEEIYWLLASSPWLIASSKGILQAAFGFFSARYRISHLAYPNREVHCHESILFISFGCIKGWGERSPLFHLKTLLPESCYCFW